MAAVHKLQAAQRAGATISAEQLPRDSVTSLTGLAHACALSIEQRLEELRGVLGPILPVYATRGDGEDDDDEDRDMRPLAVRRLASLCARLELIERAVTVLAADAAI